MIIVTHERWVVGDMVSDGTCQWGPVSSGSLCDNPTGSLRDLASPPDEEGPQQDRSDVVLRPGVPLMKVHAQRHLLFGLLALQNGLIDQVQLVAAFQAWTRLKGRALADHLVDRGDLDADQRGRIEAMVALHLKKHGSDAEKSLAAIPAGRSTRERLAALDDPEHRRHHARLGSGSTERRRRPHRQLRRRHRRPATASGSAFCGPTPAAAWARSSSRSTPS